MIEALIVCAAAQEHDAVYPLNFPNVTMGTDARMQGYGRAPCISSRGILRTRRWHRSIRVPPNLAMRWESGLASSRWYRPPLPLFYLAETAGERTSLPCLVTKGGKHR